jgi:Rrf2 family protein
MKLSSRSRYGFRALLELAIAHGSGPLQIRMIAERQNISNKYLEQLIAMMKSAGLVKSVRGPKGGYLLAKAPNEIRLSKVFTTLEGPLVIEECLEHAEYCSKCTDCVTRQVWSEMHNAIMAVLDSMTLQDLVDKIQGIDENVNFQI